MTVTKIVTSAGDIYVTTGVGNTPTGSVILQSSSPSVPEDVTQLIETGEQELKK